MKARTRYSSRMDAIEDLGELTSLGSDSLGLEDSQLANFIVENSAYAENYRSTAFILMQEGRNLLDGKSKTIQKLGGALMRVHFSNEELSEATWKHNG